MFDDDSLHLIVDEGRAQIAVQNDRFRHATDRAQLMVTVDLALLGFPCRTPPPGARSPRRSEMVGIGRMVRRSFAPR